MNQQGITDPTLISNPRMIIPQQSEIIYEIYIQAKNAIAEDLLIWLDNVLIKEMLNYEGFRAAKIYTLINDDSKSRTKKYTYYSVQFLVDSIDLLNSYLTHYGDKFRVDAAAKYGKQFTEERRILSFQKFYTYDTSFNPNTNIVTGLPSNTSLTTEPIANPQDTPGLENKKGIMSDIKAFFGFDRKREANLLLDNSNVANLAPNPVLAKNVTEPVLMQQSAQAQPQTNVVNRDKNLFFGKDDSDMNTIPPSTSRTNDNLINNDNIVGGFSSNRIIDNNNNANIIPSTNLAKEPYGENINNNNFVYEANNPNQNLNLNPEKNLAPISSQVNPLNITSSTREPGAGATDLSGLRKESQFASDFQTKNVGTTSSAQHNEKNNYSTISNASSSEANLGNFPENPITDFTGDYKKETYKGTEFTKHSGDKDYAWSKDFVESVQSGEKDFPRREFNKDVNYDYTKTDLNKEAYVGVLDDKDKDLINRNLIKNKGKEDVIVEQTTEVKDINDNQKYKSKDVYVGSIDKEKLHQIEKDFKKDLFSSPSNREYTVAYDYEEKENDVNLVNRNIGHQERFGSGKDKDLEFNKNLKENKNVTEEHQVHKKGIDDVI